MSDQKFADTHNLVAFLDKPTESEGVEEIVDFLNANPIKYALTVNPTIYCSCIKQLWDTVKAKTVNGEVQLQALVDKKKVIITESAIRRDLQLEDAEGTECLPTATIFEELTRMGMVKNMDSMVKFWMYPRFVQVFVNQQLGDMSHHKKIYVTPSHTKKIFANMKREGKSFSGTITPLFQTMMVQAQKEMSEGSANPTDPYHTPTINQPSISQPQKKQPRRKHRKDTKVSQPSGPTEPMADETENVESVPTHSNDPLLSGEDSLKLNELMEIVPTYKRSACLHGDEQFVEIKKPVVNAATTTTTTATTTVADEVEMTLAQTLIEIKSAKPKAKWIVMQEPSESTPTISSQQPSQVKAMMDVDYQMAQQLQAEEQEQLSITRAVAAVSDEKSNVVCTNS
ncbi:hypothetical protein Tco_0843938 [Tanacetum coccineum]